MSDDTITAEPPTELDLLRKVKRRETEERHRILTLRRKVMEGVLVKREAAAKSYGAGFVRLRTALMEMPAALAERLNPSDPATALEVLSAEIRRVLEAVADSVAEAKPENKSEAPSHAQDTVLLKG